MIHRRKVWLVQQGVWDMPLESMPLGMGYLKACALADEAIAAETEVVIKNFRGGDSTKSMVRALFFDDVPDVIAFSVFGWNYRSFGALVETFRQLNPQGWVIYGGTHVAHQGRRVFRAYPQVDVVVNGEGEITFCELLKAYLVGTSRHELDVIKGISFQRRDGQVVTTPEQPRIQNLDLIPSPFLSGALEMYDEHRRFRYDVAIMETNRGCPYRCAFCYWGGAIGQKVRAFSRERLREELEFFGSHRVETLVLCDANFGALPGDETFLEDLIATRSKYGYPRQLETSWAKNKSDRFFRIVRRMKETGFRSSFTLALQSLNDDALVDMKRKNMRVNQWEDLVRWLSDEGFDCYAELIYGVPGETPESFLAGYDRLAAHVSRIATYPLLLMPNTHYSEAREKYQFVTIRSDQDDFEYVLSHTTMTIQDNQDMHHFLFWARVVAENMFLRYVWTPLRELVGMTQSQLLLRLDDWFERQEDSVCQGLIACRDKMVMCFDASLVTAGVHYLYQEPGIDAALERFWEEEVLPTLPAPWQPVFRELLRYDLAARPVYDGPGEELRSLTVDLPVEEVEGEEFYVREGLEFSYDVAQLVQRIRADRERPPQPRHHRLTLYYRRGFATYVDNHEFVPHFAARTLDELTQAAMQRRSEAPLEGSYPGEVEKARVAGTVVPS